MSNNTFNTRVGKPTRDGNRTLLFDTKVVSNPSEQVFMTKGEVPKPYQLVTIDSPWGLKSAQLPLSVKAEKGDSVAVSATELDKIIAMTVIGNAGVGTADAAEFAAVFDSASAIKTTVAKAGVEVTEEVF